MNRETINKAKEARNEISGAIAASAHYARDGVDVKNIKRETLIVWRTALSALLSEAEEG